MNQGARKAALEAIVEDGAKNGERRLSELILGVNWEKHFPFALAEDEQVELVDSHDAQKFILAHQAETFEVELWGERFFGEGMSPSKVRYYETVADHFLFVHRGRPVGLVIGTLLDGNSYYLRYGLIRKEFQSEGRIQRFVAYLLQVLALHEVHRVETDVSPSNLVNIHVFNKLQFNITGLSLSERWGALIHWTKILDTRAEAIFLDQFCAGPRPQKEKALGDLIPLTKKQGGLP